MPSGDRGKEPTTLGIFGVISALALCCFIVGILAFSNGQEAQRRDKTPAAYAESAKSSAKHQCVNLKGDAAFECVYEQVETSQQQAHDEQDLTAQQKSANGTMITAALAFLGLVASVIGIVLIHNTFTETRKSNEISQSTSRPWMHITGFERLSVIIEEDMSVRIYCDYIAKNAGATPAMLLVGYCRIETWTSENRFSFSEIENSLNSQIIMNQGECVVPNATIGQDGGIGGFCEAPANKDFGYGQVTAKIVLIYRAINSPIIYTTHETWGINHGNKRGISDGPQSGPVNKVTSSLVRIEKMT